MSDTLLEYSSNNIPEFPFKSSEIGYQYPVDIIWKNKEISLRNAYDSVYWKRCNSLLRLALVDTYTSTRLWLVWLISLVFAEQRKINLLTWVKSVSFCRRNNSRNSFIKQVLINSFVFWGCNLTCFELIALTTSAP